MYSFMIAAAAGHVCHCSRIKTRERKTSALTNVSIFGTGAVTCPGRLWATSVEIQVFSRSTVTYWYFSAFLYYFKVCVMDSSKRSAICLKSWTWTVHFLNSTRLSVTKRLDFPVRRCSEQGGTLQGIYFWGHSATLLGVVKWLCSESEFCGEIYFWGNYSALLRVARWLCHEGGVVHRRVFLGVILHCCEWWSDGCGLSEGGICSRDLYLGKFFTIYRCIFGEWWNGPVENLYFWGFGWHFANMYLVG